MARGITQSFFLRQFIEEILRTGGAALAGSSPAPTSEALTAELEAVAHAAAIGLFGEATPIEVAIAGELGEVQLFQVLVAVDTVTDPRREVLASLAATDDEPVAAGDELHVPIFYTAAPNEQAIIARITARFGAALPLPVHSDELWERLTEALNAALLRYFPAPVFPADSLGGLLAGGGWTRGLSARCGALELTVESAFLDFYRTRVTSGWYEYGFVTVVRRDGVEVFRGGRGYGSERLGEGDDAPYVEAARKGDNEGIVRHFGALPTSEAARPAFEEELQRMVDLLAAGHSLNGHRDTDRLLMAAIRPPAPGSLWAWMQEALPRLLHGHTHEVAEDGTHVRLEISEVYPPEVGLIHFGSAAIRLVGLSNDPHLLPNPEGEPLQLGSVGPDALALPGPGEAEARDLEAIVATYREWLGAHLDHHVATRGLAGLDASNYYYAFDGYFPLVQLLEQRMRWEPAGPPPVPLFDEAALARAASIVRPLPTEGEHLLARFSVEGWTIELNDDLEGAPFGSYCGISLIPPEGGDQAQVMMVDAWNPPARSVVDGDAFAFRRFVTWLREAILRGGYDESRTYVEEDEDEDSDDEGYGDEDEGEDSDDDSETTLTVSEWLLFGMPDTGDRFLVDWRAQWHIVDATIRIEDFKGIYGFSGETVERLRTRDISMWRRFLREVVDPRFVHTVGERMLAGP